MKCGIVILNYKDYSLTENLLSHIKQCPSIDHIVVVDNDSPNDSYTQLKKHENDKITVLQSGHNGGYSYGNNFGARYLIENYHPDIIGIANPDVMFDDELVERIKDVFAASPDYSVLTGLQVLPSGSLGIHPFWWDESDPGSIMLQALRDILIRPLRWLLNKFVPAKSYKSYMESVRDSKEIPCQVWAVEGSLFFIRSEDFVKVGLFDENVFLYCEENILSFKIDKWLHKKVGIVNSVKYIHPKQDSDALKKLKIIHVSSVYYFNNYVTNNRILHMLYAFMLRLQRVRLFFAYSVRGLVHKLRR